ncbi:MAG TPA: hypothetical protein VJK72_04060 [Candidatus Nanoarchaeia archaeon]|nr:hypothetical protein [Candidatus Nanoarchaeia archaeon]
MSGKMSENAQRKNELVLIYNEEVYDKLKDTIFQFKRCSGIADSDFKIEVDKGVAWMMIWAGTIESGKELTDTINLVISYPIEEKFEIKITAQNEKPVNEFLSKMGSQTNKERLLKAFVKLPDGFHMQVGYKFHDNQHQAQNYNRNWSDQKPLQCNKISMTELDSSITYLENYRDRNSSQYPIVRIARILIKKDEISSAFQNLKPIHELLFELDNEPRRKMKYLQSIFGTKRGVG